MEIDRYTPRNAGKARIRVRHCLDMLERADGFADGVDWNTQIAESVTVEELVGALIAAEVDLDEISRLSESPEFVSKTSERHIGGERNG